MTILALEPATFASRFWDRYVRPAPVDRPNPRWHVSPVIDMAAYHWSWVWLLVPMLFAGPDHTQDYLFLFAIMMGFNFAHRHYGLPYAYLDGDVFHAYRKKLTWFPLFCVLLLLVTPALLNASVGGTMGRQIVGAVVFVSLLWTYWHTLMQKYGILRLYMAKDPAPKERKTPGWVDRYFILCWFPLYFSYLAPKYQQLIFDNGPSVRPYTRIIIGFMERHEAFFVVPSALVAAVAIALWIWHDWRAHGLANRARLSAAAGTLVLSTALFWTDPIKAYIAFAFSHAVEYIVFVWAYQRRFYRAPRPQPSLLQRLLSRHARLWYAGFTAAFITMGMLATLWGRSVFVTARPVVFLGLTGTQWFFYYAVYESLIHFYMDGFLWKMRRAEVRANI